MGNGVDGWMGGCMKGGKGRVGGWIGDVEVGVV